MGCSDAGTEEGDRKPIFCNPPIHPVRVCTPIARPARTQQRGEKGGGGPQGVVEEAERSAPYVRDHPEFVGAGLGRRSRLLPLHPATFSSRPGRRGGQVCLCLVWRVGEGYAPRNCPLPSAFKSTRPSPLSMGVVCACSVPNPSCRLSGLAVQRAPPSLCSAECRWGHAGVLTRKRPGKDW